MAHRLHKRSCEGLSRRRAAKDRARVRGGWYTRPEYQMLILVWGCGRRSHYTFCGIARHALSDKDHKPYGNTENRHAKEKAPPPGIPYVVEAPNG